MSRKTGIKEGQHDASCRQLAQGSLPRSDSSATSISESMSTSRKDGRSSVNISSAEYHSLLRSASEYNSLKKALLAGGVGIETLDVLINETVPKPSNELPESIEDTPKKPKLSAAVPMSYTTRRYFNTPPTLEKSENGSGMDSARREIPITPSSTFLEPEEMGKVVEVAESQGDPSFEDDYSDRSLVISGLARSTALADILKVVRGGQILNVFIRSHERNAYLSFVDSIAAEKFLRFTKRTGLQIRGKSVEVFWDERQRRLPAYICQRIFYDGATRNLVIRFVNPQITADSIRDDMDHIHRLEVVSITFDSNHAFISTNSISHALVARSCMRSRLNYQGTRIEFYSDECDHPLPDISNVWYRTQDKPVQQPRPISHPNRFAPLVASAEDE